MNCSIVIALPKIEDAKKIRSILSRYGFSVTSVCNTGAAALAEMSGVDAGILICGYRLSDMYYLDILDNKPDSFELLLLGSRRVIEEAPNTVITVEMPLRASDLVNTVDMMVTQLDRRLKKLRKRPKKRSIEEENAIASAKLLLMERNHMSEEDAYRYIQKNSMDSGTNMAETAQMILMLMNDEV